MKRVRYSECAIGVENRRRKWYIHIKYKNDPLCSGPAVCIDRRCEESSVLAAGAVSKAADVGFIDGVQEWAVSLKHTSKDHHTVCLCALMHACLFAHKLMLTWIRCSSVAWSWFLDRTLISSFSGGLDRAEGAGQLSWATADNPPLDFAWVNTLGERSRLGATVAGIRWGEMTWTDRDSY